MLQDIRYAFRTMLANPLFSAMAMLSLALGIGANTAIYSFMDAILLRSLPVQNPESLVVFNWRSKGFPSTAHSFSGDNYNDPHTGFVSGNFPYPSFDVLRTNDSVFSSVFAFNNAFRLTALIQGQGSLVTAQYVSGAFFGGLAVPPAAGRLIDGGDDQAGAAPVAIAGYGFAQRRFGDAAKALGQTATINDVSFTIAGVVPPTFSGINPGNAYDLYLPLHSSILVDRIYPGDPKQKYADGNFYWVEIMGRLRPGVTMAQAQAALAPGFQHYIEGTATTAKERADLPALLLKPGAGGLDSLRRRYSQPLYILMTLVALILTIACANLANLLLARSTARRREMAVRISLGAPRARVVRQLLTESVLLAGCGALLGLAFAQWGIRGLSILLANGRQNFSVNASLNWHALAITMGLALLTGMLFGLAPALQSVRVDLTTALKQTRAGDQKMRVPSWLRFSLGQALVVTQIAISMLLLVAAGLFVRTLNNLYSIEVGFNREHVLLFTVNAKQTGYRDDALVRFYDNLQARLATIPGVRGVTASMYALVSGSNNSTGVVLPGYGGDRHSTSLLSVAPGFFGTMQIPILLGREIGERDIFSTAPVAVVNEVFAKTYLGKDNPIGRRFTLGKGPNAIDFEIVGVAKTSRYSTLKQDTPPVVYLPYSQIMRQLYALTYELRAVGDPMALTTAARQIVREADPRVPLSDIGTQAARIDQSIGQERTFAMLCTCFAVLAVVIACVGLYGTMAYSVARRTNELGLRMALGAERTRLIWMVLREVLLLAMAGLAIGVPVAFATTHFVQAFLFGMKSNDPLAIAGAAAILALAALAAGYGPAWRASRIDPWSALRDE